MQWHTMILLCAVSAHRARAQENAQGIARYAAPVHLRLRHEVFALAVNWERSSQDVRHATRVQKRVGRSGASSSGVCGASCFSEAAIARPCRDANSCACVCVCCSQPLGLPGTVQKLIAGTRLNLLYAIVSRSRK